MALSSPTRSGQSCPTPGRKKNRGRAAELHKGRIGRLPQRKLNMPAMLHVFVQGNNPQHTCSTVCLFATWKNCKVVTQDHNHCCTGNHFALLPLWDAHGKLPMNTPNCQLHCFTLLGEMSASHMGCTLLILGQGQQALALAAVTG